MIRISALNDVPSDGESKDQPESRTTTKEAKEAEAFSLYNKALGLQRQGEVTRAEAMFKELLHHPFMQEAVRLVNEEGDDIIHPGLQVLYSTHKNMATLALQRGDTTAAIESLLEAVLVDGTEVTVWYRIGTLAQNLCKYSLARFSFEQGLQSNPRHWPCLDSVITILYVLNDYFHCLSFIAMALERDSGYTKGLLIRKQIYKEHAALRKDTEHFFRLCDPAIFLSDVDDKETEQFVKTAQELRQKRRDLTKVSPPSPVKLPTLADFTWKSLGRSLVALYDYITQSDPPKSLALRIDVSAYGESESKPTEAVNQMEVEEVISGNSEVRSNQTPVEEPSELLMSESNNVKAKERGVETNSTADMEISEDAGTGVPPEVALQDHNVALDPPDGGLKRGPKRKRLHLEAGTKRRSARVRNTNKKKEDETINFHELLIKFLPSSLLHLEDEEGSTEEVITEKSDNTTILPQNTDRLSLCDNEERDVKEFLIKEQKNGGLMSIMKHYLHFLSDRESYLWPDKLKTIFMEVYSRARPHLRFPDSPDFDGPDPGLRANSKLCLVYLELQLDQWLSDKVKLTPSPGPQTGTPRKSPQNPSLWGPDFPGKQFNNDLWFVSSMIGYPQILDKLWSEFSVRVFWLKSRLNILLSRLEDATSWLYATQQYLTLLAEYEKITVVYLYQCKLDFTISEENVQKQLESLERCQSLEEIQKYYDDKEYQKVVDCLLLTFKQPHTKHERRKSDHIPERRDQLLFLQDSLFKLHDFKKCLLWGEEIFHEALQHYRHMYGTVRDQWGETLSQILAGINKCLNEDNKLISSLPQPSLVRLAKNLILVIETLMDTPDSVLVMPIDSVLPWILLYKVIKHEEMKLERLRLGEVDAENGIPSSFMLLNVAHEYMGRRSWCCHSDGALLKFFVDVLHEEMENNSVFEEEISQAFEQCSYCLYGHPNKKSRVKHLQDHGCSQISLTWDKAIDLFAYFKPKTVPEFDSYKTSTVSGELEGLLRRISTLVPEKYRAGTTVEKVQAFIEGTIDKPPVQHAEKCDKAPIVKELYYLLADYYFKNKEQMKAIKFYTMDLCYNPKRVDSWAGLALARMSRLQQKLRSHELKFDMPILKQSIPSLRCFGRAVETDKTNSKLWIEYGCLAYELHSYASRQLKMNKWFPLSADLLDCSKTSRRDMLEIAENCYKQANQCESDDVEEEWLQHYMMGKVAEKSGRPPKEYLKHYRLAAMYTHEDKAVYPRKITYVVSPPHLAVEALEVFYRLHASCLKLLLNHSTTVDYSLLEEYLTEAAQTPFALAKEKRRESRESVSSGSDIEISACPLGTPVRKPSHILTTPQDHNYFRQKSKEGGEKTLPGSTAAKTETQIPLIVNNSGFVSSSENCQTLVSKPTCTQSSPQPMSLLDDSIMCQDLNAVRTPSLDQLHTGTTSHQSVQNKTPHTQPLQLEVKATLENILSKISNVEKQNNETASEEVCSKKRDAKVDLHFEIDAGEYSLSKKMAVDKPVECITTKQGTDNQEEMKQDYGPAGFHNPKHKELMDKCVAALGLCLSRFPQHYKSLYRLSHLYLNSPIHKNLNFARDLLLGNPNWQQLPHMSSPGLFADRKTTDFFKGVWRIPIDEIDRSGSFPTHLNRSIQLVLDVLKEQKDAATLFQIHHQLTRVPDLGKKYLRDAERVYFAKKAFIYSVSAMETKLPEIACVEERLLQMGYLVEVYRLWNYGVNKMAEEMDLLNDLFALAFRRLFPQQVDNKRPVLEQAMLFVQEQLSQARSQVHLMGSPRTQALSPRSLFSSPSSAEVRGQDHPFLYSTDKSEVGHKVVSPPIVAFQSTSSSNTAILDDAKVKQVLVPPDSNKQSSPLTSLPSAGGDRGQNASPAKRRSGDGSSLISQLVNQPSNILSDVENVIFKSLEELSNRPSELGETGNDELQDCITISDSSSSHSSLLHYSIEMNDSDLEEPIVLLSSDQTNDD